ncbi:ATP-dependent DNA helicase RecG [Muribaculaceae bacterium Isolate-083 (Janvier)]|nr:MULTISPECIES: ATP-binding protein [Bacteroidales]NBH91639.1 ATP-dependent DNA helicase RecG [Muribaculaceae bacterium S4]NBI20051.1 ATP-dependent DNA helicase RecG [Muribaculaceae bacterium Z1]ROS83551.1 ATP-dependent DNA helicase RecG [Muribaculaceae bacterium Isolate-036 (Harlan)]ROS94284.1 ATP-dependent DNA helicase RecG [Muribaculaceae bacterium Isolate-077 (Janvier)]ROS94359.1 ATP-dependent DNA helicase RecG [Muribaculaceae bacterium Isolate-083 (Janvier)]ROS97427.1 ATP-dependent DNA 
MPRYTIEQLQHMRESEDHVEFKKGEHGNVSYNGAGKDKPQERRRCILGYVAALCNEGGGRIVIGMHDAYPHKVIGTKQCLNGIGQLESDIYRDMGIRPDIYELYEDEEAKSGRVLVIEVPPHPIGKVFKFEDVALMRVGEELKPMDDKTFISIIQEQEPDFSEHICEGITIDDLDKEAIKVMKERYAEKQKNPTFTSLSDAQALSDLRLIIGDKVTNAALLLVGKEEVIERFYPQAKVMLEYRNTESQIHFDNRKSFGQPFFLLIDELWEEINRRNGSVPVRKGPYIFDIPFFNEDVIREIVNNAFSHRDYRFGSEIVIKQYPLKFTIINGGGFPHGVSVDNLLTTPSMPRNRLIADVLSKTGIVERSGQGVDKIFLYTLSEGKPAPDYSKTDEFNVTATLSATVKDTGFALYVQDIQDGLPDDKKLTVFEVLALCEIRDGAKRPSDKEIALKLEKLGFIEKHGKTNAQYYILPRKYYELSGDLAAYSLKTDWDINQVWAVLHPFMVKYGKAKRADINTLIGTHLSEKQLRNFIEELKQQGKLRAEGGRGYVVYYLGENA